MPRNGRDHKVETAFQDRDHAAEAIPSHAERMKRDNDVGILFPELMDRDLVFLHRIYCFISSDRTEKAWTTVRFF